MRSHSNQKGMNEIGAKTVHLISGMGEREETAICLGSVSLSWMQDTEEV